MKIYEVVGAAFLALGVGTSPTAAQQAMTYVATSGVDTGTCQRTAPCRGFSYAIMQTAAGGEIVALDVAGYGPFTIDRAITVSSAGPGRAYIGNVSYNPSGRAITVNASGPVYLRGLQIVGGKFGISVSSAPSLDISDVAISGTGTGLYIGSSTNVIVSRATFTNNTVGVDAEAGTLAMRDVLLTTGATGLLSKVNTQLVRCTIEAQTIGIEVSANSTLVKRSLVTQSVNGFQVDTGGTLSLDTTTVTGNSGGVNFAGGSAVSYGNNNITDASNGTITHVNPD